MKKRIPDILLSQFSDFIAAQTALNFPPERWGDLERGANLASKEFGFREAEAFIHWLLSSPLNREQIEILASHLTVSETYFWREPQIFEALNEHILPELIRTKKKGERRLRIWSAGCATGEEPYSIAIAVRRAIQVPEAWQITILATDINPRTLRKAKEGRYGNWSFRNVPAWLKKGYFSSDGKGKHEILPEIRKMVTFAYLNLAEDIYPSTINNTIAMDLIFCRNVLMYFAPTFAAQVGERLFRALLQGGWLMVGASELSHETFHQFSSVHFPGAIVYRKGTPRYRPPKPFHFKTVPVHEKPETVFDQPEALTPPAEPLSTEPIMPEPEPPEEPQTPPLNTALSIRALANQGELESALALCETSLAVNKLDTETHYLHAIILQEQGRGSEAVEALRRALYIDPDFVIGHFALGNLLMRLGNMQGASKSFDNVLALLNGHDPEEILPESEGLTAGRFREIINATIQAGGLEWTQT